MECVLKAFALFYTDYCLIVLSKVYLQMCDIGIIPFFVQMLIWITHFNEIIKLILLDTRLLIAFLFRIALNK